MIKITDTANGHWPSILGALAGLTNDQLTDKHQPCPLCGGKDRYRFDDQDGTGSWFCGKCGGKDESGGGGSGMDLLLRRTGWEFKEAAQRIEEHLGITPSRPEPPTKGAESVWRYSDTFYVCRFPGKKIRPLWWSGTRWEWKAPPAPRPLLNLDQLQASTGTILVVEGEKTADAAAKLYPKATVTTWPSGCKAIDKADWSPLIGRRVILWPDADEPGRQAMDRLSRKLLQLGVEQLRIVTPPTDVPDGWDLADATWTEEEAKYFITNNVSELLQLIPPAPEDGKPAEPDDLDESEPPPFRCLGFDRATYFYLPKNGGQVIALTAAQHTKSNFLSLAPLDWWCTAYKKGTRDFDLNRAADCIISLCLKQGVFDPDRIRGRGAWYDRDRVVVHLGDRLIVDGINHDIDTPPSSFYFYEQAKPLTGPAAEPLSDEFAYQIRNIATRFRWEVPANAYFLLGWAVLGPVCGALDWRPHIWVTGGAGTGKTTILKSFLKPLLGGIYQAATGGTTEAGLRGTLKSDAIPVVFDELEQNNQRDKAIVENILGLARIASSEGGKIYKGTATGGANAFEIRSMFCVSSINVALVQRADIDRFCVLSLRKQDIDEDKWHQFEKDIALTVTPERGRQLITRTLDYIPFIRKNAVTFAQALASRFGQRFGDQHGTLLAGAFSLAPDGGGVLSLDQAIQFIDGMNWEAQDVDPSEADEVKCLDFILNSIINVDNQRITIRELYDLSRTGRGIGNESPDIILARYGIKNHLNDLAIMNNQSQLSALLRDTAWSNGAHKQALRRIDGAKATSVHWPLRGTKRCTLVPFITL